MLKSSCSFYRYVMVTCEKYSHFSAIYKMSRCVDLKFKRAFNCHTVLHKKAKRKITHSIDKMKPIRSGEKQIYLYCLSSSSEEDSDREANNKTKQAECNQIKRPPLIRKWEPVFSKDSIIANPEIKIISYNILAQHLLLGHPYLYKNCATQHLDWTERSARLLNEMTAMDADILCLQEVETEHLNIFNSAFQPLGYQYVFKAKTGLGKDGCAIFYKKDVFTIKEKLSVEFNQHNFPLLKRDNIALLVKLVHKDRPQIPLVVATTHLLYNPRRADVKLAQTQLLLAEIDRFAFYKDGNLSGHHPIILTGDFNSTPNSEVVKLLINGNVFAGPLRGSGDWERLGITDNCQHLSVYLDRRAGRKTDFSSLKMQFCFLLYGSEYAYMGKERRILHSYLGLNTSYNQDRTSLQIYHSAECASQPDPSPQTEDGQKSPFSLLFNSDELWQTLCLNSVYDMPEDTACTATTFQDHWVKVDHIFFSRVSYLKLVERLELPTAEYCQSLGLVLPNDYIGSDHLALGAVFEMTPDLQ